MSEQTSETWRNASTEERVKILNDDMNKAFEAPNLLREQIGSLALLIGQTRTALEALSKEIHAQSPSQTEP